jgi:hypothetical protein
MDMRGINDVYGVGELEATGSALIEAHERGHDLNDWQRMRLLQSQVQESQRPGDTGLSLRR